jgi:ferrous iron transport protein A
MNLSELRRGEVARIHDIQADDNLTRKLVEMGLTEGLELRLSHTGPFGRDPIAIEANDRVIALRRRDASHILIDKIS